MSDPVTLPAGWAKIRLPDIAELNPRHPDAQIEDSSQVSFVPMAAVEAGSGRLNLSHVRQWKEVQKGYTRFQDGDVLFAKITPCMENGKAAFVAGLRGGVGAGSTEFHVFRPSTAVDGRFLAQFVLQEAFRRDARARMTGTAGQLRVPKTFLREYQLALPPLTEQLRITGAIDSYATRLDDAVASLKRVQANLRRYCASVLKAAVEGQLVLTEAELARKEGRDYQPVSALLGRILAERRRRWEEAELAKLKANGTIPTDDRWKKKYKGPIAPDSSGLPELPEGWHWVTVEHLSQDSSNAICAGPFGTIFKARDFRAEGIPIIFLRHVKAGRYLTRRPTFMDRRKWETLFKPYSVFGGEILVTKLGDPPGEAAIFPAANGPAMLTPDVMKLQVEERLANPRFLMHFLNSEDSRRYAFGAAFGTTRLRLTLPLFRAIPVPLPPRAEQDRIVDSADRLLSLAERQETSVGAALLRSCALRQAILVCAFEGKLVDQDPNDEPASVLLDRIRSEQAVMKPKVRSRNPRSKVEAA